MFTVEYLSDAKKIRRYAELARARRFVPCVARPSLDRIFEMPER